MLISFPTGKNQEKLLKMENFFNKIRRFSGGRKLKEASKQASISFSISPHLSAFSPGNEVLRNVFVLIRFSCDLISSFPTSHRPIEFLIVHHARL